MINLDLLNYILAREQNGSGNRYRAVAGRVNRARNPLLDKSGNTTQSAFGPTLPPQFATPPVTGDYPGELASEKTSRHSRIRELLGSSDELSEMNESAGDSLANLQERRENAHANLQSMIQSVLQPTPGAAPTVPGLPSGGGGGYAPGIAPALPGSGVSGGGSSLTGGSSGFSGYYNANPQNPSATGLIPQGQGQGNAYAGSPINVPAPVVAPDPSPSPAANPVGPAPGSTPSGHDSWMNQRPSSSQSIVGMTGSTTVPLIEPNPSPQAPPSERSSILPILALIRRILGQ